jgi:TRAP-type C4-dicarboxylate transport system substrate-binding protein
MPAGCGDTNSSDKAGGTRTGKPVVLTVANGLGGSLEVDAFAETVARRSGGTLRIRFHNDWRKGSIAYQTELISDVQAGKADLGVAPTGAFDDVGVASFDALNAPLLIDNYPLEQKVLESPLVDSMLAGLKRLDVVGLGILPGPLRKPLGVAPLVRASDYRAKTLAITRSRIATQTLRALGATAKAIPRGGAINGLDGIEQQVASIDGNRYDKVGKSLTANVNLWPRPLVVFVNRHAYARLSDTQRAALAGAARSALPATFAFDRGDEKDSAANLCRRGLKFAAATNADLAALRRVVQPVYDTLQRDALTKTAVAQIQTMRTGTAAIGDAPTCHPSAHATSTAKRTPIDGSYRQHTTASDLRAAGTPEGDINPGNYGILETVFDRGRFTQKQSAGGSATGTYAVHGHTLTMTYAGASQDGPGDVFTFRWSLYRDLLTLKAVPGESSPPPALAKPWRRIGDAP